MRAPYALHKVAIVRLINVIFEQVSEHDIAVIVLTTSRHVAILKNKQTAPVAIARLTNLKLVSE